LENQMGKLFRPRSLGMLQKIIYAYCVGLTIRSGSSYSRRGKRCILYHIHLLPQHRIRAERLAGCVDYFFDLPMLTQHSNGGLRYAIPTLQFGYIVGRKPPYYGSG